ncbi:MAG: hypothetical protein Q9169_006541 [Polycauliona sp. 2 TL-2023]
MRPHLPNTMDAVNEYERYLRQLAEQLQRQTQYTSSTTIISVFLIIVLAYQLLPSPGNSISDLLWRFAIFAIPKTLIHALESRIVPRSMIQATPSAEPSKSQIHSQKSEIVKRLFGLDGAGLLSTFQRSKTLPLCGPLPQSTPHDKPPGLGNWDNSCYQNSVIQGLASLPSFAAFLDDAPSAHPSLSTKAALKDIIGKLRERPSLGAMFWTPAQLKSMSSWQQQDAQEYFSKLMDEVEKEARQTSKETVNHPGLTALRPSTLGRTESVAARINRVEEIQPSLPKETQALRQLPDEMYSVLARNPLEGLLAQRVGCLECGYVEGLSLIPFNCLTLPLGKQWLYDIRSCLDEFTTLEPINGVDCAKCTLLRSKAQLEKLRDQFSDGTGKTLQSSAPSVSDALKTSVDERLHTVTEALDNEDFSDNTILKKCQISQKAKVSSTKTRQAVIARAPESLAIHINRSVFNEMTGALSKNHAEVRFPLRFSLAPWCLGGQRTIANKDEDNEQWNTIPGESMLGEDILEEPDNEVPQMYELRAALTHYGRHENGHYICYRRDKSSTDATLGRPDDPASWWRFSDEDVNAVSEDDVLAQGGVFMLFYEKVGAPPPTLQSGTPPVEQNVSDVPILNEDLITTESIKMNPEGDESSIVEASTKAIEAKGEEKAHYSDDCPIDVLPKEAAEPKTTDLNATKSPANCQASEQDCANSPDETRQGQHTSPVAEPDQTRTSSPDSITTNLEDQRSASSQDPHPPLLSPSPILQTDNRNITPTMRTAAPRSGRGSISRGQKGMGQVSSMVTSH